MKKKKKPSKHKFFILKKKQRKTFNKELKKDGKFSLVVAGQVKAGKSTFLNALLGEDVLPTDVLQSTSAIIEVFHSKCCFAL